MEKLEQKRTRADELFPFPEDGRLLEENPPCLSWLKVGGEKEYTAVLYRDGRELWRGTTDQNYIVPDPLPGPGQYTWNLFAGNKERGEFAFILSENFVSVRRTTGSALYDAIPDERPRHLFSASDVEALRERKAVCRNLAETVQCAYADGLPERPMFHRNPNALPYREYFGRFRDFCDRDLVACALCFAVLGDEKAGRHAKELLLTFCDWNPAGLYVPQGK